MIGQLKRIVLAVEYTCKALALYSPPIMYTSFLGIAVEIWFIEGHLSWDWFIHIIFHDDIFHDQMIYFVHL